MELTEAEISARSAELQLETELMWAAAGINIGGLAGELLEQKHSVGEGR